MSLDDSKGIVGKTKAILLEEEKHERWVSWFRLCMGLVAAALFFWSYVVGYSNATVLYLQLAIAAALCLYSGYFLVLHKGSLGARYSPVVLIFFDVTTVSYILWSYHFGGSSAYFINSALFGLYFIALAFTALHHRARFSILGGCLAAAQYSVLYFVFLFPVETSGTGWAVDYLLHVAALLVVSSVSGVISRNNFLTIQRVVSSDIRYQNLVNHLPELVFTLDSKGNFLWGNMASQTILGLPPKVLPNRSVWDFLVDPNQLQLRGEEVRSTFEIQSFTGDHKFVDFTLRRVDKEDSRAAWEGIMSDVTDKEIAISQREQMANRLFHHQKMESLGTLASGMAHDFNNILQTVTDIVGFVVDETGESETKKRMELITETLVDARFLVSELLAVGRKKPLDYRAINLSEFLEKTVPLYRQHLGPSYEIVCRVHERGLWIQGNPDYFKRIVQNLVGNSRDAMPKGGTITIECFAVRRKGEANTVVIRLADTGFGIPSELIENIFDPFFTTKKPGKGTGLGLALVRRIVTLHKGHVFVERSDSHGTAFRMEFPESEREDQDMDTKQIMLNRRSSTILLIDDDPKIREILKIFIKGLGYPVCEAANRQESVNELKRHAAECNVVIMDWKLGREDPHRLIKELRAIKPELIVIVVSGYPPKSKSIDSMRIHKWFTKPYDKNMLDLEIQRALFRLARQT